MHSAKNVALSRGRITRDRPRSDGESSPGSILPLKSCTLVLGLPPAAPPMRSKSLPRRRHSMRLACTFRLPSDCWLGGNCLRMVHSQRLAAQEQARRLQLHGGWMADGGFMTHVAGWATGHAEPGSLCAERSLRHKSNNKALLAAGKKSSRGNAGWRYLLVGIQATVAADAHAAEKVGDGLRRIYAQAAKNIDPDELRAE